MGKDPVIWILFFDVDSICCEKGRLEEHTGTAEDHD
jgi:hypothetical protein